MKEFSNVKPRNSDGARKTQDKEPCFIGLALSPNKPKAHRLYNHEIFFKSLCCLLNLMKTNKIGPGESF